MKTATIIAFIVSLWKIILNWFKGKQSTKITPLQSDNVIELPTVEIVSVVPTEAKVITKPTKEIEVKVVEPKKEESKKIDVKPPVKVESKVENKKSQLILTRTTFTENSTIGELTIDGKFICYVLEDKDRKLETGSKKVFSETAIPRGTYEIIINWSNRFQRQMPLLLNVPQFEGIRIHGGSTKESTSGCLICGFIKGKDRIQNSKEATRMVTEIIAEKLKKEKVFITIK